MLPASETPRVTQALALAQDPEYRHLQHVPSWNPDAPPHPGIWDRLEEADQIEIGCSSCGVEHCRRMTAAVDPDDDSSARAPVTYFVSTLPWRWSRESSCGHRRSLRLAYVEERPDEKQATTVRFLLRAVGWVDGQAMSCKTVLSDNGSVYRSNSWREVR